MADARSRGGPATEGPAAPADSAGRPRGRAAAASVVFFCSVCGSRLVAPEGSHGQALGCPYCLRETLVPRQPLAPGEPEHADSVFERQRILSLRMRFLCPQCGCKLASDARASGVPGECPECGGQIRVPELPGLLPSIAAEDGATDGAEADDAGDRAGLLSAAEIRFLTAGSHG